MHEAPRYWPGQDPNGPKVARVSDFPTQSVAIDISATDADFSANPLRWIWVGTTGHLGVQLAEDAAPFQYQNVPPGWWKGVVFKISKSLTTAQNLMGAR